MYGSFNGKSKARTSYGWLIRNVNQKDFTQDLDLEQMFSLYFCCLLSFVNVTLTSRVQNLSVSSAWYNP